MNRPLDKWQRTKLESIKLRLDRTAAEIWGALPPSYDRDSIRHYLYNASEVIKKMLDEPEQITMEECLDEDSTT